MSRPANSSLEMPLVGMKSEETDERGHAHRDSKIYPGEKVDVSMTGNRSDL